MLGTSDEKVRNPSADSQDTDYNSYSKAFVTGEELVLKDVFNF